MARQARPRGTVLLILFGVTLLVVGTLTTVASVWHHFGHLASRGPGAVPGARTVEVQLRDFSFSPQVIAARVGEPLNLRLINVGAELHDFTIATQGIHRAAQPAEPVTIGVRTTQPGAFEFYCSVTGHRERGMVGRFVVQPPEQYKGAQPVTTPPQEERTAEP